MGEGRTTQEQLSRTTQEQLSRAKQDARAEARMMQMDLVRDSLNKSVMQRKALVYHNAER